MKITKTYIGTLEEIEGIWCDFIPEGAVIEETKDILRAEDNYILQRISDNIIVGNAIWLNNGDVQENYREIPEPQPEPEDDNN